MTVKRFVDEKKGEYWKEYKDGYFFSNFGRAKHVYKNGSEYLLSPYIVDITLSIKTRLEVITVL